MPRKKNAEDVEFDVRVGQRIEKARLRAGLSAVKVANPVGISTQQLYWYEAGRTSCPLRTLTKIARALGVPVASLMPIPT